MAIFQKLINDVVVIIIIKVLYIIYNLSLAPNIHHNHPYFHFTGTVGFGFSSTPSDNLLLNRCYGLYNQFKVSFLLTREVVLLSATSLVVI